MSTNSASVPFHTSRSFTSEAAQPSALTSAVVLAGRLLFTFIFIFGGLSNFSHQTITYAAAQGVPLASIAVPLSGVLAHRRRTQHSAWLSRPHWRMADRAVPGRRHAIDAQLLGCKGPDDGADADGHVPEEPVDVGRRVVDLAVRRRAVEPGRAAQFQVSQPSRRVAGPYSYSVARYHKHFVRGCGTAGKDAYGLRASGPNWEWKCRASAWDA